MPDAATQPFIVGRSVRHKTTAQVWKILEIEHDTLKCQKKVKGRLREATFRFDEVDHYSSAGRDRGTAGRSITLKG
ncbi:hypothetical protein D7S86_27085 [Pararobbsia silviterrae]|uniref:Uncharacterized protein n=1 Tax=Pararobbsia silviterrae TaxID=1792498 RepID=A0A494X1V4_9BURK|nr:hypothetical protein D7S86_27085 [Pararobbsia silviterrae]